jgi:hypothetical protein
MKKNIKDSGIQIGETMDECEHKNTIIYKDVGFDTYTTDDGDVVEENQNMEKCLDCHKSRLICICFHLSGDPTHTHKTPWGDYPDDL